MPKDKTGTICLSCIFSEVIVSVGLRRKEVEIVTRRTLLSRQSRGSPIGFSSSLAVSAGDGPSVFFILCSESWGWRIGLPHPFLPFWVNFRSVSPPLGMTRSTSMKHKIITSPSPSSSFLFPSEDIFAPSPFRPVPSAYQTILLFEQWVASVLQARKGLQVLESRNGLYVLYMDRVTGESARRVRQNMSLQRLKRQHLDIESETSYYYEGCGERSSF
ncbi:hypothetical protein ACFX2K_026147 [Malus domestica]